MSDPDGDSDFMSSESEHSDEDLLRLLLNGPRVKNTSTIDYKTMLLYTCLVLHLLVFSIHAVDFEKPTTIDGSTGTTVADADPTTTPGPTTDANPTTDASAPPTTSAPPPTTTAPPPPTTTTAPPPTTTTPQPTTIPPTDIQGTSFVFAPPDKPYKPGSTATKIFQVDPGYFISATLSDVDIDGDSGDYLLIKSGTALDDDTGDGRLFTYGIKKTTKYLFQSNSVVAHFKITGTNAKGHLGYSVLFERTGDPPTTTPDPTTPGPTWPSTEAFDSVYINVNVSGKAFDEFEKKSVVAGFKGSVVAMAEQYVQDEKVTLTEKITDKNVIIEEITPCPFNWPDNDDCVQMTFKLPIYHDEMKWSGYQMDTYHLEKMWKKYAVKHLDHAGLKVYEEPDIDTMVMWWGIAIGVVTVAFIVILGILRVASVKFTALLTRSRRLSDTRSIISSKKDSVASMGPHYFQEPPKFFENEYTTVPDALD